MESRGIALTVARGRLVARSVKPIHAEERLLIELAEELLVGHLSGAPVLCVECQQPAVTVVLPRAPACAAHAAGEAK